MLLSFGTGKLYNHTPSIMHIKKNVMALSQNEPSKEHFPYLYIVYNYSTWTEPYFGCF